MKEMWETLRGLAGFRHVVGIKTATLAYFFWFGFSKVIARLSSKVYPGLFDNFCWIGDLFFEEGKRIDFD